ncbi:MULTISPECIES: hypothetical protein [unclassified Virgibacillus]|uniref:TsoY family (seleno)protein n=1 Tax=unclassified Virgibacillus TaxID=2620237 RepID=UPI0024DE7F48|nr:hypothetical protein [Virgibacillus sp. LDC-1]
MRKNLGSNYNPLYFLASLGSGGLAVSFYMYFMFMVQHPGRPMANFEHVFPLIGKENMAVSLLIVIAIMAIIFMGYKHVQLLLWNIKEYRAFKQTEAFEKLKNSNAAVSLMAIPLTLAMTINVLLIFAGLFIPNLWNVVEYMFPFALLGFSAVGIYALIIFKGYMTRFLMKEGFDPVKNNSLSQLLAVFAFVMIAVGFAAPGAMSSTLWVSTIGIVFSIFFATLAIVLFVAHLILGTAAMFEHGIDKIGSPSIWMAIPIMTILGITFVRLFMGVNHNLLQEANPSPLPLFIVLAVFVSIQLVFGIIGYAVLKKIGYFEDMIHGEGKNAGTYGLICPGVAFMVLGMFFIHWGFVQNGIVTKFSPIYFIMLVPYVFVQLKTLSIMFKINKKHFSVSSKVLVAKGQSILRNE